MREESYSLVGKQKLYVQMQKVCMVKNRDAEGVVKNRGEIRVVTAVVKGTLHTEKEPGLSAQIEQLSRQLDKRKYQLAQKDPRSIQKKQPSGYLRVRKVGSWNPGLWEVWPFKEIVSWHF